MRNSFLTINKKTIPLLILVFLLSSVAVSQAKVDYNTVHKSYNVRVFIDEKSNEVEFNGELGKPFIALGRTFVPYRILAERMGAQVGWNGQERIVSADTEDYSVKMTIGDPQYRVNGKTKTMDVEPFILATEGRTYIPARYLTEGLGYIVDYTHATDGGEAIYVVSFTQGQSEAERKKVLDEISKIPSKPEVVEEQKIGDVYLISKEKEKEVMKVPFGKWVEIRSHYGECQKSNPDFVDEVMGYLTYHLPELATNQKFYTSSNLFWSDRNNIMCLRGILITYNTDGSTTEKVMDLGVDYGAKAGEPFGFHKVALTDLMLRDQ